MPCIPRAVHRLARPASLRDGAYEAIVDMIVERVLRPGQHLRESELAQLLGVSRQPVREALQLCQSEGWVELRPGYGAFVHVPTAAEADQLLAVRTILNVEAARLAASQVTETDIVHLHEAVRRGMSALNSGELSGLVEANRDFHLTIARASGNPALLALVQRVETRARRFYQVTAGTESSWDEHRELFEAIKAGDAPGAVEISRQHLERTRATYNPHRHE
jgi:DNA-binding GntR family transcriptional regulator